MPYLLGQANDYWRRKNQRRALTGLPSSYQEERGAMDSLLGTAADKDIREAQIRSQYNLQNRQLSLQEQAQKDAARAASISGITNLASLGAQSYLGYKYLTKPSSPIEQYYAGLLKGHGAAPAVAGGAPLGTAAPSMLAPAYTGGSAVPASVTAGASGLEYGSAAGAGSGGAGLLTGAGSGAGASQAGSLAAYDSALAAGAAEGVGSTAGTAAAGLGATGLLGAAGAGALGGSLLGSTLDKILPGGGKTGKAVGGAAGGAIAGAAMGSVVPGVGTAIGAVVGGVVGFAQEMSLICSELLRQGWITEKDRSKCIVYRFHNIPDDMFAAYMEWAAPIVAIMKREGVGNALLLPFMKAFVGYMIFRKPTLFQRLVWKYAWWRCEKIAQRHEQSVKEVA